MYLKGIEVFGFKSFMNKLEFRFGDGLTAIIGPNGCGKSNISDALRWVLGEQNARLLRGETMDDVIFNGTRTRKPLGMAEVSLTISNEARTFPIDFPEIRVTRRVYRSGVSEYLINKSPCRLKDVKNLFMDTGLGSSSYILLERNMVDNLLNNTSVNLRFMLEEAAGIMKYKSQEKIALRRLDATEGDLLRIRDIVAEVEKRVRALKRQIGKAKRHGALTEEIRRLSLAAGRLELARLAGEGRSMRGLRDEARRRHGELAARLAGIEASIERDKLGLRGKEEELAGAQGRLDRTDGKIEKVQSEILVLDERTKMITARRRSLDREIEEANGKIRETAKARWEKDAERERTVERIRSLEEEAEKKKKENARIVEQVTHAKSELLQRKRQTLDLFHGESEKRNEVGNLETRLANLLERREALDGSLASRAEEEPRLAGEAARAAREHEEQSAEVRDLRARRDAAEAGLEEARARRTEIAERLVLLQGKRESLASSLEILQKLRSEYEGYRNGVRALLTEEGTGAAVDGVVAERIEVEPAEYGAAFENALGDALQCVLVGTEKDALRLIDFLRKGEKGWAALAPRDRFAGVSPPPPDDLLAEKGVVGPAADFVRATGGLDRLVRFLLADVVFVEDLETALRLAREERYRAFRFTTAGGEGARYPGVIFGGRRSGEGAGIFERRSRIAEIESDLKEVSTEVEKTARAKEKIEAAFGRAHAERGEVVAALDRAVEGVEEAARERARLRTALEGVRQRIESLRGERDALEGGLTEARRRLEGVLTEARTIGADGSEANRSLREIEAEMVELEMKREEGRRALTAARVALAEGEGERNSLDAELASLARREAELAAEATRKREDRAEGDRTLEETAKRRTLLDEKEARLAGRREKEVAARDEILAEVNRLAGGIREREESIKGDRREKEERGEEMHRLDLRLREIALQRENLVERARDEFGLALSEEEEEEGGDPVEGMSEEEMRGRVSSLKEALRRLGPVNLVALDEFDEENERYEFLKGQEEDLLEARDSLRETIRTVDKKARALFMETFGRVRENFRETFASLFEGGEADLKMEDPGDPLGSDLVIIARPGQKRPQKIALLSGGERALTAIAILFALYLEKPSPFCILDELDAPLDDANVGRFLEMLGRFTDKTQFVVITHNRRTMASANYLYGITMEEAGVSRAVSVRLGGRSLTPEEEEERIVMIEGSGA